MLNVEQNKMHAKMLIQEALEILCQENPQTGRAVSRLVDAAGLMTEVTYIESTSKKDHEYELIGHKHFTGMEFRVQLSPNALTRLLNWNKVDDGSSKNSEQMRGQSE